MPWEELRPVNGRPQSRLHIGDFILNTEEVFRDYCDTAAGDTDVRVTPGRYPVYALRDCGRPWHSLTCEMPGVVAFPNGYLGLKVGEPRSVHLSLRQYAIARGALDGISRVELLPSIEARAVDGGHGLYHNGEEL